MTANLSGRATALIVGLAATLASAGCQAPGGVPPSTPVLLGVSDNPCAEMAPSTPGGFRVLPRQGIVLRVAAAWPTADLVLRVDGTQFEKVGPSDTQRQSDLRAADAGFWVPDNIDPNPLPAAWTVSVNLPQNKRSGPLTLEFVSRGGSADSPPLTVSAVEDLHAVATGPRRVDLDWRDRDGEDGYVLERNQNGGPFSPLASIGKDVTTYTDGSTRGNIRYGYRLKAQNCRPPSNALSMSEATVTTPKESGTDEITFFRSNDPGDDQFVYTSPLLLFDPDDAIITNVTNVSEDRNGNGVKLELVRHTDATIGTRTLPAASCPNAPLEPQSSTPTFNTQTVKGAWKVRAVCISQALLNDPPARIALRVSWTQ